MRDRRVQFLRAHTCLSGNNDTPMIVLFRKTVGTQFSAVCVHWSTLGSMDSGPRCRLYRSSTRNLKKKPRLGANSFTDQDNAGHGNAIAYSTADVIDLSLSQNSDGGIDWLGPVIGCWAFDSDAETPPICHSVASRSTRTLCKGLGYLTSDGRLND